MVGAVENSESTPRFEAKAVGNWTELVGSSWH